MFEDEEWRPIAEEHLVHYLISTHGRVKHVERPEQARKISINDKGFPVIVLYGADSKTRYLRQINNLVANAYIPQPVYDDNGAPLSAIWHIDGDLKNCHVDNLKWETRRRVLEWNDMWRTQKPQVVTPRVKNNRTGMIFDNAFKAGLHDGFLESDIVWKIEVQARHDQDDSARYRYLYGEKDD